MATAEERVQMREAFNRWGLYREGPGFNLDLNFVATLAAANINYNGAAPAPPAAPARIILPPPAPVVPPAPPIMTVQMDEFLASSPSGELCLLVVADRILMSMKLGLPSPAGPNDVCEPITFQ